ncbi:MAG: DsrE family protein [Chromatiales bacterium]
MARIMFVVPVLLAALLAGAGPAGAQAAGAGSPVDAAVAAKAVFHVNIASPAKLAVHLGVIERTWKDLKARGSEPDLVVVFIGPSVRYLTTAPGDQIALEYEDVLKRIAASVGRLGGNGVRLEICGLAMQAFGVDPATVLPGLEAVDNGYLPVIDYQARGYSLVPVF